MVNKYQWKNCCWKRLNNSHHVSLNNMVKPNVMQRAFSSQQDNLQFFQLNGKLTTSTLYCRNYIIINNSEHIFTEKIDTQT